jgi:hypothetical protein
MLSALRRSERATGSAWKTSLLANRFVVLSLAVVALVALFATPALAAPVFSGAVVPAGTTTSTARPMLSVQIADPLKVNKSLTSMKLDNVSVVATFTYTTTDQKNASLAYTRPSDLSVGVHTVKVTSYNQSNQLSTTQWTFTVAAAPPTLSNPVPAANSVVTTTTPTIACLVPASYAGVSATATIDGRAVTAQVGGSVPPTITVVNMTGLSNDTTHTVAVTATGPGGRTTLTWAFKVQIYPPMPNTDCVACHAAYPAAHDTTSAASCAKCHAANAPIGGGYTAGLFPLHTSSKLTGMNCSTCHMTGQWPTVTPMHAMNAQDTNHTPALDATCKICHAANLTNEHARYSVTATTTSPIPGGVVPGAFGCLTCHTSTDAVVIASVGKALSVPGSGNNDCNACHAGAGHSSDHPVTPDVFCGKAGCHVATQLTDEHIDAPLVPAHAKTCETCHLSADTKVTAAITAKDTTCEHCHGTTLVSGHEVMHATVMASECAYCHDGSIASEHLIRHNPSGATNCYTCHHSTDTTIVAAIASGPPGRECPVCHTDSGHQAVHGADFSGQTAPGANDCADCHASNLQTEHLKTTSTDHESKCYHCHKTPAAGDDTFAAITIAALNGQTWNSTCSQGDCHKGATAQAVHADIDASHTLNPTNASCLVAGCHASDGVVVFAGKTLDQIHSAATTTVAGTTRTGCLVCHNNPNVPNNGGIPTSSDCLTCHPERAASHGYNVALHTSTDTCTGACHGGSSELGVVHRAVTPTPVVCADCHDSGVVASITPWDKTCAECHPIVTGHVGASHVGTDLAAQADRAAYYGEAVGARGGCTDSGMYSGCHDISDVSALHTSLADKGCPLCHGTGKTPKSECGDCHKFGLDTTTVPLGTMVYHHLNKKYLFDQSDLRNAGDDYFLQTDAQYTRSWIYPPAVEGAYVNAIGGDWAAPTHGWDMTRYDYDCASSCHTATGSAAWNVFGGTGKVGSEYGGPLTEKVWDAGGSAGRAWWREERYLTASNPITWTYGDAPTLTFDASYASDPNGQYGSEGTSLRVEISTDTASWAAWTPLTNGTVSGAPADISEPGSHSWTSFSYDLSGVVATTTGSPIYNQDPGTWTWTWASWVPAWLQLDQFKGQSFWFDETFYNTLTPEQQSEYYNLLYGDWTYYEGSDFGSYTKPIVGYNTASAPFKIRFVARDCGGVGLAFKTKNVALAGTTHTYASGWRTMQSDYFTATSVSLLGSYYDMLRTYWTQADSKIGDGTSAMWYTGSGDNGQTADRILELKDGVDTADWLTTTLEFDSAYWLEGGDTAEVQIAESWDGGVSYGSWQTLYGSQLRTAEQVQDSDPAHWTWYWYTDWDTGEPLDMGPDYIGNTSYGYWYKPLVTLPLPVASSTASMTGASADGWIHKTYDISRGTKVKIRFVYHNATDSAAWGWGINHITISNQDTCGLTKSASANAANWNATNWSRYGGQGKMWYPMATSYLPWTRILGLQSFTVPADGATKLSFMTKYDFGHKGIGWYSGSYGPDFDPDFAWADGYVDVSTDNGASWTPISGTVGTVTGSVVASMTNSAGKWVPAQYDLSAYAGQNVKVRFRQESWSWAYGGMGHWGIDNIGISNSATGGIFNDDAETLKSQWEPTYWIRAMGAVVGMGGGAWGY